DILTNKDEIKDFGADPGIFKSIFGSPQLSTVPEKRLHAFLIEDRGERYLKALQTGPDPKPSHQASDSMYEVMYLATNYISARFGNAIYSMTTAVLNVTADAGFVDPSELNLERFNLLSETLKEFFRRYIHTLNDYFHDDYGESYK